MQEQFNPREELLKFIKGGSILSRLLIINTGVWLLVMVIIIFAFLFAIEEESVQGFIIDILAVPSALGSLIVRPWTLFTYMFLHIDFWHILFNMLWLYWFGRIFLQFLGEKQMLATYILGGLAGGLLYILFYNVFPVFSEALPYSHALGASASVMAVVTAISFYTPNYHIHIAFTRIKIRIVYIAIALFILDFFAIRSSNSGGHIAHIGGAIYGFIYAGYLRKGKDWSNIMDLFSLKGLRRYFTTSPGTRGTSGGANSRPITDEEYNDIRAEQQQIVDRILEKIKKSGYDSLTKKEKEILFKSSNKNQ